MARMQLLLLVVGAFALHQSSSSEVRVDMIAGACYINQLAVALQGVEVALAARILLAAVRVL